MTVQNSTLSGNSATYGGGIFEYGGTVTVENSTLSGNSALIGGGIHNDGTVTVQNSTISGNSAATAAASTTGAHWRHRTASWRSKRRVLIA